MENTIREIDLLIIGTGPAGLASAIYSSRAGISTIVTEINAPGGRLINTHKIENYPGVGKVTGFEMAKNFLDDSTKFGAEIIYSGVKEIDHDKKIAILVNEKKIKYKALLISTGTKSRGLDNVPGYKEFINKGVSHCAVCDGAFFKEKDVAIIGGGNSATEESLFIKDIVNSITILNAFDKFNAEEITLNTVKKAENIKLLTNSNLKTINGKEKVESITYEKDGEEITLNVSGVFIYVGNIPNTQFIKNLKITNDDGYIKVDKNMETSIPGIFAAGDVIEKDVRQITTAVSEGTIASINIKKFIDNLNE